MLTHPAQSVEVQVADLAPEVHEFFGWIILFLFGFIQLVGAQGVSGRESSAAVAAGRGPDPLQLGGPFLPFFSAVHVSVLCGKMEVFVARGVEGESGCCCCWI